MTATEPTLPVELTEVGWAAARIAAGEPTPDAPDGARELAERALEAADRHVMDDLVDALDAAHEPSQHSGPQVSDAGACRRQVWYRERPPEGYEPLPEEYRRPAALGTAIHAAAARARAVRYPWRLYELEIPVPGLDKRARVDEYDPILGEVTDIKTASSRRWERYADGPAEEAWAQVMVYAYALDQAGLPVRSVRIVLINRDNGDEEHFVREYDPQVALRALDRLVELATMLDLGVVPPRDGTGPSAFPCSACPARLHCWNVEAAQAAGRSPESYTILGPEPDDPSIAWAAEQVVEAAAAKRAAEKAKKAADALLVGIPPGEYGDYEIRPMSREMPDYKGSFERLLGFYALSDQHRPPLEKVSQPLTRIDRWIEARRKRAGKRQQKSRKDGGQP